MNSYTPVDEPRLKTIAEENDEAEEQYPPVLVDGHLLHIFKRDDEWDIWLNTEDLCFTGLCIGTGKTRDEAVAQAVRALEAAVEELQKPPRRIVSIP